METQFKAPSTDWRKSGERAAAINPALVPQYHAVAAELGYHYGDKRDSWRFEPSEFRTETEEAGGSFIRADGLRLWIACGRSENKVECQTSQVEFKKPGGIYRQGLRDMLEYKDRHNWRAECKIDLERFINSDAVRIAAEIARKVIEPALAPWAIAQERMRVAEETTDTLEATARALAAAYGGKARIPGEDKYFSEAVWVNFYNVIPGLHEVQIRGADSFDIAPDSRGFTVSRRVFDAMVKAMRAEAAEAAKSKGEG